VAGIIAAAGSLARNETRGVAPGSTIVSVKVLGADGSGHVSDLLEGIDWVIANRARYQIKVINLSLGAAVQQSWRDDPVCQAIERAWRANIVTVAAAGNYGKTANGTEILGGVTSPGNCPYAITAGALNTKGTTYRSDDAIATYSSARADADRPSDQAGPAGAGEQDTEPAGARRVDRDAASRARGGDEAGAVGDEHVVGGRGGRRGAAARGASEGEGGNDPRAAAAWR